jgi:hypothetical protein
MQMQQAGADPQQQEQEGGEEGGLTEKDKQLMAKYQGIAEMEAEEDETDN